VVGGGLPLAEAERERERVSLSLLEKREKVNDSRKVISVRCVVYLWCTGGGE
jgi:hypothetical protein